MGEQTPDEDRSDQQLTPEEAYKLTEESGMMGKTVAQMYDVTPGYVSQLKGEYERGIEKGKEQGREEVDPTDFEADTLEAALSDKREESRFGAKCPSCGEPIPTPDEAGEEPCPECGTSLEWAEEEL